MAPLPTAKQNPPAASSQPIKLPGSLLVRIAPTAASGSATRPCPTAPSRSPPDRTVTRLIATKTTDTTHIAQAATVVARGDPERAAGAAIGPGRRGSIGGVDLRAIPAVSTDRQVTGAGSSPPLRES